MALGLSYAMIVPSWADQLLSQPLMVQIRIHNVDTLDIGMKQFG